MSITTLVDEDVRAAVLAWLRSHPLATDIDGQGDIATCFQTGPVARRAGLPDFLLKTLDSDEWYVRWPSGTLRWETRQSLVERGIVVPSAPAVMECAVW